MDIAARLSALYHERKKTFIAVCILLVILFIGTIIGFLVPPEPAQTRENEEEGLISAAPIDPAEETYVDNFAEPTDIPFIEKEDLEPTLTPTPTPLPGPFYTANGQQNDLRIRLFRHDTGNSFYEVQLINSKTTEIRVLGYTYAYAHGDSAFFSKDFSQVIFVGGSKRDYQQIQYYSIPQNKIVKAITLDTIKKAIPGLKTDTTYILSSMYASPDKTKVALSYGDTYGLTRITPNTGIIVMNLATNKMQLLPAKGLVIGWKDDRTVQYDVNTTNREVNNTLEVTVPGI